MPVMSRFITMACVILSVSPFCTLSAEEPIVPVPRHSPSPDGIKAYLDELIDSLVAHDRFSGAVLVAGDGKPLYTRAEGLASKSFKAPNRVDTKFNLASMNKMFTGVAIMQLAQSGKLSFDDVVGKHLPDYPNEQVRNGVTIHHLLTHTSGMGLFWMQFFQSANWAQLKSVADFDNLANTQPLLFEPGEKFEYSNCGPLVLGLIIEAISGQTYDDYIRDHVTGPAGMSNTDCYDISVPTENLAIGYTKMTPFGQPLSEWHNNLFMNPVKGAPDGGGYSTVEDLLKFDKALRDNVLISREYFDIMTAGKVDMVIMGKKLGRYGYLFVEQDINGHRLVGHSGGAAGINSYLDMYMDLGYTVAVMSNYDRGSTPIVEALREWLTRD